MRIIKYIFFLVLLAIIAVVVYVATQKSEFSVQKSVFINVPKSVVFNYVNDYKNWEDWGSWKEDDATMEFKYSETTIGKGAYYLWSGKNGNGKTTTTFVKQNDSIAQKGHYFGNPNHSYITFKDSVGGTNLTWFSKGSVDFATKVKATFSGGINQAVESMFMRSLNNLNIAISKEINIFNVKINGIVTKPGGFYVKQSAVCKVDDFQNKVQTMLPKIIKFFKKNKLAMNGKPFIIYQNKNKDTIQFAICGPLKDEIFISSGSDIGTGFLETFSALKTTLTGDYSHLYKAKNKAKDYLIENNLTANLAVNEVDIFIKSASDIKNPSQWITEILIPLNAANAISNPLPKNADASGVLKSATKIKPSEPVSPL